MGIAYRCDKVNGITVTVWDGFVTPDDWRALVARQDEDPDWPTGPAFLGVITGARGLSAFGETVVEEMRSRYLERAKHLSRIRSAIVADRGFDAARRLEEAAENAGGVRTIMFTDVGTACTWLGVFAGTVQTIVDELRAELRDKTSRP